MRGRCRGVDRIPGQARFHLGALLARQLARRRVGRTETTCQGLGLLVIGNDCEHTLHQPFRFWLVARVELLLRTLQQQVDRPRERGLCFALFGLREQHGLEQVERVAAFGRLEPAGMQRCPGSRQDGIGAPCCCGFRGGRHRRRGDCRRLVRLRLAADEERDDQRQRHQADQGEVTAGHAGRRAAQTAQQRQQRVAGFAPLAALDVPADRCLQEHARPPRRRGFVHEPVDQAGADQRGEQGFVGTRAGDADDDVRELLDDLLDEGIGASRDRGHVDDQHAAASVDQQVGRLVGRACAPDRILLADCFACRLKQFRVGRQHHHVHEHRARNGSGVNGQIGRIRDGQGIAGHRAAIARQVAPTLHLEMSKT